MSDNKQLTPDAVVIAGHNPVRQSVKQGQDYYYCTCGRSKSQPFCDGSHQGTSFTPQVFTPKEDMLVQFCQCKHTKNPPFCDGSHLKLK